MPSDKRLKWSSENPCGEHVFSMMRFIGKFRTSLVNSLPNWIEVLHIFGVRHITFETRLQSANVLPQQIQLLTRGVKDFAEFGLRHLQGKYDVLPRPSLMRRAGVSLTYLFDFFRI